MNTRTMRVPVSAILAIVLLLAAAGRAEAYVDPGAGSMLVQLLVGGLMAVIVLFRSGWQRIWRWVRRQPTNRETEGK